MVLLHPLLPVLVLPFHYFVGIDHRLKPTNLLQLYTRHPKRYRHLEYTIGLRYTINSPHNGHESSGNVETTASLPSGVNQGSLEHGRRESTAGSMPLEQSATWG